MSDSYAGLTALQENVVKTKEHVEGVRSALDTAKQNVFQYTTMVSPSADQLNRVVQFVGNTDSTYTHGYFYTCESDGSGGYQWTEIEFGSIGDFLEETTELPTATASNVGHTYLLVAPQTGYRVGGIYQNQSDGEAPPTYSWVLISANPMQGVPEGGTTGQVLTKKSNNDYDTEWDDAQSPLESGNGITIEDGKINADTNIFNGTRAQYEALSADDKKKYSHIGSPEEEEINAHNVIEDLSDSLQSSAVTINATVKCYKCGQMVVLSLKGTPISQNGYITGVPKIQSAGAGAIISQGADATGYLKTSDIGSQTIIVNIGGSNKNYVGSIVYFTD